MFSRSGQIEKNEATYNSFGSIARTPGQDERVHTFRRMERWDIPWLLKVTRDNMAQVILSAWGVEWSDETLLDTLLDPNITTEILSEDGAALGYASFDRRGDYLFVVSVQICRGNQGHGLGRRTMEHVERLATTSGMEGVELCVQSTNRIALGFYHHLGYSIVSRERNNIIMRKRLVPT
jgi:ribosomal protein S18 acetylase RimI-like enzyme